MGRDYPYLNDLERKCIAGHFSALAMPGRVATRAYPDQIAKATQGWLEAFALTGGHWVVVKKEESLAAAGEVSQLIVARDLGFFAAMHELAQFEAEKVQSGIQPLADAPHRHYTEAAEQAGLVFDTNLMPHPTDGGQIMGDSSFPQAVYDRAEAMAARRVAAGKSPVESFIGEMRLRTGPVYFDEAVRLQELIQSMEEVDSIVRDIRTNRDGINHTAILHGLSGSNLGKALDINLAECRKKTEALVRSEMMKQAFEPDMLAWLSEAGTAHGYFARIAAAQKTMNVTGLAAQGRDYLTRITKEAADCLCVLSALPVDEAMKAVQRKVMGYREGRYYDGDDSHRKVTNWVRALHGQLVARSMDDAKPAPHIRSVSRFTPFV